MKFKLGDLGVGFNLEQIKKAAESVVKALPHTTGRVKRICKDKVLEPIASKVRGPIAKLERESASANLKRDFKEAAAPGKPKIEESKKVTVQKPVFKTGKSIGR